MLICSMQSFDSVLRMYINSHWTFMSLIQTQRCFLVLLKKKSIHSFLLSLCRKLKMDVLPSTDTLLMPRSTTPISSWSPKGECLIWALHLVFQSCSKTHIDIWNQCMCVFPHLSVSFTIHSQWVPLHSRLDPSPLESFFVAIPNPCRVFSFPGEYFLWPKAHSASWPVNGSICLKSSPRIQWL